MGKVTGFVEFTRETPTRRPVEERVQDWREVYQAFPASNVARQAARCMDCGVPFCNSGCPLNNVIPDWNDLVYKDRWRDAIRFLHATNNFPEFTGRLCPAPCEAACVLGINEAPVAIKAIECAIVDRAFEEGWIQAEAPAAWTGKRVAIIGSGPAGLAAAQQLARAGQAVTVFEKSDRIGGLLRYGIPDFKMEKRLIDRRIEQMRAEGVEFIVNAEVGTSVSVEDLRRDFHAVVIATGAEQPRDLAVPGRELKGIHFAMDFLRQQNRRVAEDTEDAAEAILATGKHVVILGGGDTGADCLGTAHRQKAASVRQFEIAQMPPAERAESTPWPVWPLQLRAESSHEEGGLREWSVQTTRFSGNGGVEKLHFVRVGDAGREEFSLDADLVLLAMGFTGPSRPGLLEKLGVNLDSRGNVAAENYQTSIPGMFAAGDARRGQSLIVWAVAEGRKAAAAVEGYLRSVSPHAESNSDFSRAASVSSTLRPSAVT
jgi:glutamate synthase (NADPH) small chain